MEVPKMKKSYVHPKSEIRRWRAAAIVTVSSLVDWDDDWNIGNDQASKDDPSLPFVPF